jgi:hypothetical protein
MIRIPEELSEPLHRRIPTPESEPAALIKT